MKAVREVRADWGRPDRSSGRPAEIAAPLGLLGLIGVQFLPGMAVNPFVPIPSARAGMPEMMGNAPLVGLHMLLDMVLAAGAVLGVATLLPSGRRATACAAIALGGIPVGGYVAEVVTVH